MYEDYLYQQQIREVSDFGWEQIKELASADAQEDERGRLVGSFYLGTVFGLTPSGKYYTPFANSNVAPCPHCAGTGKVKNLNLHIPHWVTLTALADAVRKAGRALFPGQKWDTEVFDFLDYLQPKAAAVAPTITCPFCSGMGSEEAYHDSLFWDALTEVAEAHGMYIGEGEGDPTDVFAFISIKAPQEPEV